MNRLSAISILATYGFAALLLAQDTDAVSIHARKKFHCSNLKCEHFCISDKNNQPECVCHRGYMLQGNRRSCNDIDECLAKSNLCGNGTCHNSFGSYFCSCKYGYYFDKTAGTCKDVDECESSKICGEGECINAPGLYECKCYQGYHFNQRSWYCEAEIYECEDKVNSCRINSLCIDLYGDFKCKAVKCPNAYYVRKSPTECILKCPYFHEECEKLITKSVKWIPQSFRHSMAENQTLFVFWYASETKLLQQNMKFSLDAGYGNKDFSIEHMENKFIRVINREEIKGPKSYEIVLNVDTTKFGRKNRRTFIVNLSISE